MANEYNSKIVLATGEVLLDLTADTVEEQYVLDGHTFHDKTGAPKVGKNTFDSDTSEDTAAIGEILEGKTAHARGAKLVGNMPNNGGVNGQITSLNQKYVIPQGYHDGSGGVTITTEDKNKLIPSNIREGITVLGVAGEMSGSEDVKAQSKSATPKFTSQTISPDGDFTHLSQVTVNPITVTYSDNAAGGKTVTIGAV